MPSKVVLHSLPSQIIPQVPVVIHLSLFTHIYSKPIHLSLFLPVGWLDLKIEVLFSIHSYACISVVYLVDYSLINYCMTFRCYIGCSDEICTTL